MPKVTARVWNPQSGLSSNPRVLNGQKIGTPSPEKEPARPAPRGKSGKVDAPTPELKLGEHKTPEIKPRKVSVATPGSPEARAILGKKAGKALAGELSDRVSASPQEKQNKDAGFTTNVRTHRAPEYVAKKQQHAENPELSMGGQIQNEHALPGGRNNPIHSTVPHVTDVTDKRTAILGVHSAGHIKARASNRHNSAEAHRSAFHATLGSGPIPRGMEVPCSTPGCKNINVDKRSCADGGCNVPSVDVKR